MNRHTKIAIDLDGVLASFASEWRRIVCQICKEHGIGEEQIKQEQTDYDLGSILLLPKDERENIVWLALEKIENSSNFWMDLKPYPNAQFHHPALCDVFYVTSRRPTAGLSVMQQTETWLNGYGFRIGSVIPVPHANDKVDLVQLLEIDYLLDDRFETIWRLNKRAAGKGFVLDRPWNAKPKDYAKDEPRVNSVQEFLDMALT